MIIMLPRVRHSMLDDSWNLDGKGEQLKGDMGFVLERLDSFTGESWEICERKLSAG